MTDANTRARLSHHEQMKDAETLCAPCKLCGGKAIISDAGDGAGYYIRCENGEAFRAFNGCMIGHQRLGGWAYNVMDWWNRLHAFATPARVDRRWYLDLDGVMADFDAHFPALFGIDHRKMLDDDMWAKINAHSSYFRDMPPCPGATEFFATIKHLDPIILTACPKSNYAHVAVQKREWVREHLSTDCIILPVMGGRHKPLFMHAPGDVLIDDFASNCEAWSKAGGVAIQHTSFAATADAILALLDPHP